MISSLQLVWFAWLKWADGRGVFVSYIMNTYKKILPVLFLGLVFLLSQTLVASAAGVVGIGTPASCTEAAFDAALAGGGLVTFDCGGGAVTIPITSQKTIGADTTINGGGLITLNAGGATRIFEVSPGFTLTLEDMTLALGTAIGAGNGGAVLVNATAALTATGVTFTGNSTQVDEGGAIASFGTINISQSFFLSNQAAGVGGAIYIQSGTVNVIDSSTFATNNAPGGGDDGGAIVLNGGVLTITDSMFNNNYCADNGGAINVFAGTLTVTDTTFQNHNNALIQEGGALFLSNGVVELYGVTFTNNHAPLADGGAINLNSGTLLVDSSASNASTFTNNQANRNGGAIFVENSAAILTVNGAEFTSNTANVGGTGSGGGAIYHGAGTDFALTDSTFTGNQAAGDGGAILMNSGGSSLAVSGSTFTNNTASDDGGAIYYNGNTFPEIFEVTTSTFSGNTANGADGEAGGGAIYITPDSFNFLSNEISLSSFIGNSVNSSTDFSRGGAIYNAGNSLTVANVTFSGNEANKTVAGVGDPQGGALYTVVSTTVYNSTFSGNSITEAGGTAAGGGSIYSTGTTTLANTIVANGSAGGTADNCGGTITDSGNNIDFNGGAACGAGFSTADPGLGSLTASPAYYPISLTSAALDAGNNAVCSNGFVNNESQNGLTRPIDGNGDTTATCDIGSFERSSDNIVPTVTVNQAVGQDDPTSNSPINFTVVFSEVVTGFDSSDVVLGGTAGATTAVVTGSGTTYNVAVSGMVTSGTVTASVPADAALDVGGNGNTASTSTDNTVTFEQPAVPSVTLNQAAGQEDPTSTSPINFTVVFSEVVTGFDSSDVVLGGTAGATTAVVTGSGTTYNVAVSGMVTSGTVIASVPADAAVDGDSNGNTASTSDDNTVTYEPVVIPSVTLNQAAGQEDPTSTSPINFTVVFSEVVTGFDSSDVVLGGTAGATTAVVTGSGTTYNVAVSGMVTTGTVTASIPADAAVNGDGIGNTASNSDDNTVTYQLLESTVGSLPSTGFTPGVVSALPNQPAEKAYASTDLVLEIPSLDVDIQIVGVPVVDEEWDVTWLGNNAGYLYGSAFPTWAGNTIITGHVWDANNNPGPFAGLKDLKYGDQIKIHAWSQTYTYEVQESELVLPRRVSNVFQHEELDWVTLVTCEYFNPLNSSYLFRRVVRAVLVDVQ